MTLVAVLGSVATLTILEKNILNFDCSDKTKIIEKDILEILDFNIFNKKFNIIFIDPPYKEKILSKLLKKIFQSKILNENGIIVIHRHKNEKEEFGIFFKILEEKNYGISKLIFGKFNFTSSTTFLLIMSCILLFIDSIEKFSLANIDCFLASGKYFL